MDSLHSNGRIEEGRSFVDFNLSCDRGESYDSSQSIGGQASTLTITLKGDIVLDDESRLSDTPLFVLSKGTEVTDATTSLENDNENVAQIDPPCFAPSTERKNSKEQRTKTSLLYVLFEYCLNSGKLNLQFIDDCSTIWRLEKFVNASFHLDFQNSVRQWRSKIEKDEVLRNRLINQHRMELIRLTYPLPKRRGVSPIRKRGYKDKGSTRLHHQRHRTDKDTVVSVYLKDLEVVRKVVVGGRRPSVTYRRLPYSEEIGRALELGLLMIEGDFVVPTYQKED